MVEVDDSVRVDTEVATETTVAVLVAVVDVVVEEAATITLDRVTPIHEQALEYLTAPEHADA